AVAESFDSALVVYQLEDIRWADVDARVAARASVIVDGVDEELLPGGFGRLRARTALASTKHDANEHAQDRKTDRRSDRNQRFPEDGVFPSLMPRGGPYQSIHLAAEGWGADPHIMDPESPPVPPY